MVIDRRTFAIGALAFVSGRALADGRSSTARDVIAATVRRADGSFAAVLYDLDKGLIDLAALPARGHDVTVDPVTRTCVAFARRPGTFAVAFARPRDHAPVAFTTPPDRHFYGHGVFSRDGRWLYTTENDFNNARGVIGVWDVAAGYRRAGEWPSYGVGPHDLDLLADGHTLVVANGGIETHPDFGREPLNLATMEPSLAYLDARSGRLLERHAIPRELHKVSIRHMGLAADDTVVFGCQFKGPRTEMPELIGFHRRGESIVFLDGGAETALALNHYVSSIAVEASGSIAGATSSRGGAVVMIDIAQRKLLATHRLADVSGIAAAARPKAFVATSGTGATARMVGADVKAAQALPWAWDNHAISVPV